MVEKQLHSTKGREGSFGSLEGVYLSSGWHSKEIDESRRQNWQAQFYGCPRALVSFLLVAVGLSFLLLF